MTRKKKAQNTPRAETYRHPTAESLLRPDAGTSRPSFARKNRTLPTDNDSSLDPTISWDGVTQNI